MRIDRWNRNTLRRYHLESGAIAIVCREQGRPRQCRMIPASIPNISVEVTGDIVLHFIRQARLLQRTAL